MNIILLDQNTKLIRIESFLDENGAAEYLAKHPELHAYPHQNDETIIYAINTGMLH